MDRREMLKVSAAGLTSVVLPAVSATSAFADVKSKAAAPKSVQQWDCFEVALQGPSTGNPFLDVTLSANFSQGHRTLNVPGFYDGNGNYLVRFMPDSQGTWTYTTVSSHKELDGHSGSLLATAPGKDNKGPVGVAHQFHFAYTDGTPYFPFGTTCYSMGFMGEPYEQQTMDALKSAGFNKVRLCLLPKPQDKRKLPSMPFEHAAGSPASTDGLLKDGGKSQEKFDLTRLNPGYFQHFESRVRDLMAVNIQADVILFHPYDAWGFRSMGAEADDRYLRYAIARLSAYRNVWWAIANEYDLIPAKTVSDWDRFFRITQASDPYSHLRSIHHSRVIYDNAKPWCTHASLQTHDFEKSEERRAAWNKPIVYDEIQYEGDIARRWGNLAAEEMTHRFWLAIINGAYATHGETFITPNEEPVWSDGGKLRGSSAPRLLFLRTLLQDLNVPGLNEVPNAYYFTAASGNDVFLYYFDTHALGEYDFPLPEGIRFKGTLIDTFAMTKEALPGVFTGKTKGVSFVDENAGDKVEGGTNHLKLPGRPYLAVAFERIRS